MFKPPEEAPSELARRDGPLRNPPKEGAYHRPQVTVRREPSSYVEASSPDRGLLALGTRRSNERCWQESAHENRPPAPIQRRAAPRSALTLVPHRDRALLCPQPRERPRPRRVVVSPARRRSRRPAAHALARRPARS